MALNDVQVFNTVPDKLGDNTLTVEDAAVIKLALIDSVITPTAADLTPMWSAGSNQDYDGNEVAEFVGGYSQGGVTLANVVFTQTATVTKLDADDVSLTQNAAGFDDARWGIIYDDGATNKDCLAFIDLGAAVSQVAGPVTIAFNAGGIFTVTVNDTFT